MINVRDRYFKDPAFAALVDNLYVHIAKGDFTPTEIREAAMVAMMKYEDYHPRRIPDPDKPEEIEAWIKGELR